MATAVPDWKLTPPEPPDMDAAREYAEQHVLDFDTIDEWIAVLNEWQGEHEQLCAAYLGQEQNKCHASLEIAEAIDVLENLQSFTKKAPRGGHQQRRP